MNVSSIGGENAGSSKGKSGVVQHGGVLGTQLSNKRVQRVAGRYSVDNKGTRDEGGGMSGGGGEEDEDLGILFCGERGAMLAT